MAAPLKRKLEYASWDVDWYLDPLVIHLEMECGPLARLIYHDLVNWAYRTNGYYFNNTQDELLVFCHAHRYDLAKTKKVVESSCNLGLFDKDMAVDNAVLTSMRMQKNFCEATKRRKLMYSEMEFMYTEIKFLYTENTKNATTTRQSKVKESKENTPPTPSRKIARGRVRDFVSDSCLKDLSDAYGTMAIGKLIDDMQDYLESSGKTYANYDTALRSWAKRKLTPIPAWQNCTNKDCHHGWILTTQSGEVVSTPCPECNKKGLSHEHQ